MEKTVALQWIDDSHQIADVLTKVITSPTEMQRKRELLHVFDVERVHSTGLPPDKLTGRGVCWSERLLAAGRSRTSGVRVLLSFHRIALSTRLSTPHAFSVSSGPNTDAIRDFMCHSALVYRCKGPSILPPPRAPARLSTPHAFSATWRLLHGRAFHLHRVLPSFPRCAFVAESGLTRVRRRAGPH